MNKLTFIFSLLAFLVLTSCGSDSGEQTADSAPNALVEIAKIDSVTTVLQQTEIELQTTEKALDAALKDLDL